MPLGVVSQPLVTTVPVSLPIVSTTVVVMATLTPAIITLAVITTTAATLVVSTAPMAVIPQGSAVSSTQQFVPPIVEVTEAITVVTTGGVPIPSQSSTAGTSSVTPAAPGVFPLATQSSNVGNFHHPFRAYSPCESPHCYSTLQPEACFRGADGSQRINYSFGFCCDYHSYSG